MLTSVIKIGMELARKTLIFYFGYIFDIEYFAML